MIWLFERGDDVTRITTRRTKVPAEYSILIEWSDGRQDVETYQDPDAFEARLQALERQLAADRWTQVGSPQLIAGDWRGPTH